MAAELQLPTLRRGKESKDREEEAGHFFTASFKNKSQRFNLVPGVEILSFLPLQMSLYFNVYYSICWIVTLIVTLELKFNSLAFHYKFITILLYVIMFVIEIGRLYLGYEGNLREKVAELSGFWLLSLLQLPLVLYLMANINTIVLPLEWAVNIPMIVLLIVQLLCGVRALQLMIRSQAIKYHIGHRHMQLRLSHVDFISDRTSTS
jgi:transmembrane protein 17